MKKYLPSTWFFESKILYKKKMEKKKIKINHSAIHNLILITTLNIYNPLNNIKFTHKKSEKENYLILNFLKIKYHKKRKKNIKFTKEKKMKKEITKYLISWK